MRYILFAATLLTSAVGCHKKADPWAEGAPPPTATYTVPHGWIGTGKVLGGPFGNCLQRSDSKVRLMVFLEPPDSVRAEALYETWKAHGNEWYGGAYQSMWQSKTQDEYKITVFLTGPATIDFTPDFWTVVNSVQVEPRN